MGGYNKKTQKWGVQRWSKNENKEFFNGYYGDEERAAHASDTLARKLMTSGEHNLKLNFPDDHAETYPEKKNTASKYTGVFYIKNTSKWLAQRWSNSEKKRVYNRCYDDIET